MADGSDRSLWPIFFDIERTLLRQTAFYPMLGNHERNSSNYYESMQSTPYYSFNWGSAHFSILDSDWGNFAQGDTARNTFWKEQTDWLEEDLAKAEKSEFRFVAAHHPPLTAVASRQGDNPHVTALMPIFDKHHVTATFFGHEHNYQHYFKNGVHYIITGGGGAPLYDVDQPPQGITVVATTENSVRVRVSGKLAHADAILPDGLTLDTTEFEGASY